MSPAAPPAGSVASAATDGYTRLGLVGNPFVAEPTPGVAQAHFTDVGLPPPPPAGVVELVGPRGAGKTTHLLRWCRLRGGRYTHIGRVGPAWPPLGPAAAWDEADRLPRALLRARLGSARRRGALVLLATHTATGLADTTVVMPPPTAATVTAFAARRIRAAALPGVTPLLLLPPTLAADVAGCSDGSWWTVGTALHVWAAERAGAGWTG